MTEKGEPMLLMGLFTADVIGGREVMAAADGASGGECWPDGGEDTDELSGLRESAGSEERLHLQFECQVKHIHSLNPINKCPLIERQLLCSEQQKKNKKLNL